MMHHIFRMRYILQVFNSIVAFVTVLVIYEGTMWSWWWPQECICNKTVDKMFCGWNGSVKIALRVPHGPSVHESVSQHHPTKWAHHSSVELHTGRRVPDAPPFLTWQYILVDVLKSKLKAFPDSLIFAPHWHTRRCHAKMLCGHCDRWALYPVLWPDRSPLNRLPQFGSTTLTWRVGIRVLHIERVADKVKIFQAVVFLIAIPMMNLPHIWIFWKTMKRQLDNSVHEPTLLSQLNLSVSCSMQVPQRYVPHFIAEPSVWADVPRALCTWNPLSWNPPCEWRQCNMPVKLFSPCSHEIFACKPPLKPTENVQTYWNLKWSINIRHLNTSKHALWIYA